MRIERVTVLFLVAVFCLTTSSVFAAAKSWFVTKDKRGVCKVIKAKTKTHAAIAGPFATRKEALREKEKECGTAVPSRKSTKKPVRPEPSSQTGETGAQPVSPGQPSPQGPPSNK